MKNYLQITFTFLTILGIAQKSGIQLSNMDKTISPKDNFYYYCNGSWVKNTKIPNSEGSYGTRKEIRDNNLQNVKSIYDEVSLNKSVLKNSNLQKLRDFYNEAMDSVKLNTLGYKPILNQLKQIDEIKSLDDFIVLKANFDRIGIKLLFGYDVLIDFKNNKKYCYAIFHEGYGLEDRDLYYESQFEEVRIGYKKCLTQLFTFINENEAEKKATEVFEFEKKLNLKALSNSEMRDFKKMINPYSIQQLKAITPNINWDIYYKTINFKQPDTTIVGMVEYFKQLSLLLTETPLETLKTYAKAALLRSSAKFLSHHFEEAEFNFYSKILKGSKTQKPRWERVHNVINTNMSDLISEPYVKKYFNSNVKVKTNNMIDTIILTYRERISSRNWLSDSTKKEAYKKLDLISRKIGYPEQWQDCSSLIFKTNNYWENICIINSFGFKPQLDKLKKDVDRNTWEDSPLTVVARYIAQKNEMDFTATFIQPPYFDITSDDAANYGRLGSIIAHELTHGFDDQGVNFDAEGNMRMWMTHKDFEKFKEKKQAIINQFNSFIVIDSLHVNGKMTQGENIAELGGLIISFYAYKKTLKNKAPQIMDGFTNEQRFFIAYTQGTKLKFRDAELKRVLSVDNHSPAPQRVTGVLTNFDEFYKAFDVKEGDKMFTPVEQRIEIW